MAISHKILRVALAFGAVLTLSCASAFGLHVAENQGNGGVNMRVTAETGSIITTIPMGMRVAVLDDSSEWLQVAYDGKVGYVRGDLLVSVEDGAARLGTMYVNCKDSVNFRQLPNTEATVLGGLSAGSTVNAVGVIDGWFLVETMGQVGYIHSEYLAFTYEAPTAPTAPVVDAQLATSDSAASAVIAYAAQFLGTPYVYGGRSPSGFDCSGLTSYAYEYALGISIPRTSLAQSQAFTKIENPADLLPGDLVFFGSTSVGHVGIYVGDGKFIHSPHTGDVVRYADLSTGSYANSFKWGGRVLL